MHACRESKRSIFCVDTGSQVCNIVFSPSSFSLLSTHGFSLNQIFIWRYNLPLLLAAAAPTAATPAAAAAAAAAAGTPAAAAVESAAAPAAAAAAAAARPSPIECLYQQNQNTHTPHAVPVARTVTLTGKGLGFRVY